MIKKHLADLKLATKVMIQAEGEDTAITLKTLLSLIEMTEGKDPGETS